MIKDRPVGVTIDRGGNPTLLFSDGCTYDKKVEKVLYSEYYPNGKHWPVNPSTGKRLPVFDPAKQ